MATYKQGILGSFSGKVGNVVGASWRGTAYMRSLPKAVRNPKTQKQVEARNRLSAVVAALKPFKDFIRAGFVKTGSVSPWSTAIKANIPALSKDDDGNWTLQPSNFVLTNGTKVYNDVQVDTADLSSVGVSWPTFSVDDDFYGATIMVGFFNEDTGRSCSLAFPGLSGSMVLDISEIGEASAGKLHVFTAVATADLASALNHKTV